MMPILVIFFLVFFIALAFIIAYDTWSSKRYWKNREAKEKRAYIELYGEEYQTEGEYIKDIYGSNHSSASDWHGL